MEYINLNVTNRKKLKELGYDDEIYYCGPYKCQKQITWLHKRFKKLGIPFPFNPACFKHDLLYGNTKPFNVKNKLKVDWVFFKDMCKILLARSKTNKTVKKYYRRLIMRIFFYYIFVTIMTPVYLRRFNKK